MVAIKYSVAAALLSSSVMAAPVASVTVPELHTSTALVKLLRDSANSIANGLFHLTSLTVNHEVDNVENFTSIFEELLKDVGVVVPGLDGIVNLGDNALSSILVPGINVVVNLSVQVINGLLDGIGQTIPKKLEDNVLYKFLELLQTGRGIVTGLGGNLTKLNVPAASQLNDLLPKIDSATNATKMCKDKKVCNGW
ncbi:hypothetical protein CJU90_1436 [Yarrowia sp. C11]|nr:hypothetical protein CKK34_0160 [Yarrowia sp. E02]KAG5371407.1 hypothetical protein CJU90_1436 [Yarrowia sp. C11]